MPYGAAAAGRNPAGLLSGTLVIDWRGPGADVRVLPDQREAVRDRGQFVAALDLVRGETLLENPPPYWASFMPVMNVANSGWS